MVGDPSKDLSRNTDTKISNPYPCRRAGRRHVRIVNPARASRPSTDVLGSGTTFLPFRMLRVEKLTSSSTAVPAPKNWKPTASTSAKSAVVGTEVRLVKGTVSEVIRAPQRLSGVQLSRI